MTTRFSPNLNNDPWPMNFWWADFIRRDEDKDGLPLLFCHSIQENSSAKAKRRPFF